MLIFTDSHIRRKTKYWGNIGVYPIKYLKIAEGKDVIEIKTETMTSAATFTHLDVSTIESNKPEENTDIISTMGIVHSIIASVGMVTNLTVVVVFLHHRKLRRKVPNICIINQVRFVFPLSSVEFCKQLQQFKENKSEANGALLSVQKIYQWRGS